MSYKILDERDVNQTYSPESENAQSGKAVDEAIKTEVGEIDESGSYGVKIVDGHLSISPASTKDVTERSNKKPMTPSVFEYALMSSVDKTYSPKSPMPQSGIAVAEAIATVSSGGTWEKIVDITTTEEVNSITATAEEFPKLAKCKEFLMIVSFPKTESNLTLGTSKATINSNGICFYSGTTNPTSTHEYEQRARISIINNEIDSIMSVGAPAGLKQTAYMSCGRRNINGDVYKFVYGLNTLENMLPIGTKLTLQGKVEG